MHAMRRITLAVIVAGALGCSGGGSSTPTPAPPTYTVSGRVTTTGGAPASGVTVSLPGAIGTATTDAFGDYSFSGLASGTYTVTPSKAGYEFAPPSRSVPVSGANVTAQDFTMGSGNWDFLVWTQDVWK